jgi:hypothetical protein
MNRRLTFLCALLLAGIAGPAAAQWSFDDTRASHRVHEPAPAPPLADRLTAVTLDGRRGALYDGPREVARWDAADERLAAAVVSRDARHLFTLRGDGWLVRSRLPALEAQAEIRVGLHASRLALSADGRYLLAASDEPPSLLVMRAEDLAPLHRIDGVDKSGRPSTFSWLGVAARRESFLAALADAPELWELSYADDPPAVFPGLVHDYRLGEGLAATGAFPVRRIFLPVCLGAAVIGPADENLVGVPCEASALRVINLLVGREIRRLPGTDARSSGAIAPWRGDGRAWAAVASAGGIDFFDLLDGVRRAHTDLPRPAVAITAEPGRQRLWAMLAGTGGQTSLAVIDARGGANPVAAAPAARAMRFSEDGAWAYVVSADGVRVLDAHTLAPLTNGR